MERNFRNPAGVSKSTNSLDEVRVQEEEEEKNLFLPPASSAVVAVVDVFVDDATDATDDAVTVDAADATGGSRKMLLLERGESTSERGDMLDSHMEKEQGDMGGD